MTWDDFVDRWGFPIGVGSLTIMALLIGAYFLELLSSWALFTSIALYLALCCLMAMDVCHQIGPLPELGSMPERIGRRRAQIVCTVATTFVATLMFLWFVLTLEPFRQQFRGVYYAIKFAIHRRRRRNSHA